MRPLVRPRTGAQIPSDFVRIGAQKPETPATREPRGRCGRRRPMAITTARIIGTAALGAIVATAVAGTAGACGGLIGENGTIQLVRTTTLAGYSDGVERYVTAFEFIGRARRSDRSFLFLAYRPRSGAVAMDAAAARAGGGAARAEFARGAAAASGRAEVLLEVEIDALDITVLRGGGDEVGEWAVENGFLLTPDAPEVLDFYARRSPVFMAARFNAERAAELDQEAGDSTPIMATIPTETHGCRCGPRSAPWIARIEADVSSSLRASPSCSLEAPASPVAERAGQRTSLDDLRSESGWSGSERDVAHVSELELRRVSSTTTGRLRHPWGGARLRRHRGCGARDGAGRRGWRWHRPLAGVRRSRRWPAAGAGGCW